jgi:hypothetical protein
VVAPVKKREQEGTAQTESRRAERIHGLALDHAINLDLGVEYNPYNYEITGDGETYKYTDNYFRFHYFWCFPFWWQIGFCK